MPVEKRRIWNKDAPSALLDGAAAVVSFAPCDNGCDHLHAKTLLLDRGLTQQQLSHDMNRAAWRAQNPEKTDPLRLVTVNIAQVDETDAGNAVVSISGNVAADQFDEVIEALHILIINLNNERNERVEQRKDS